ncbi:MAG: hypothetical protein Q4G34_00500 [Micrococcus sp.]|nr:hypothetical protein [Micrococcus sp.]
MSPDDPRLFLAPNESVTLWIVLDETGNSANESGCIESALEIVFASGELQGEGCGTATVPQVCFDTTPPTC